MVATMTLRFGHQADGGRLTALILALVISLSMAVPAQAKSWIELPLYKSGAQTYGLSVTVDGLKTIGKNTTGGFMAGAATGGTAAAFSAAGVVTAPISPWAYAVPIVTLTLGGFLKGVSDALWDGEAQFAVYNW